MLRVRVEIICTLWLILITAASLAGVAPADEKVLDFSGTWILDPAQSLTEYTSPEIRKLNIEAGGPVARDSTNRNTRDVSVAETMAGRAANLALQVVQTSSEVQVTRQFTIIGQKQTVTQKFALDGSQCFNVASDGRSGFVSRTAWRKDKLIHSGTQTLTIQDWRTEIYVKEEYSISKNGKKLTIKTMLTAPEGVTTLKQEFHRQE